MLDIFAASVNDDIISGATPEVLSLAKLITFPKYQNLSLIIVTQILIYLFASLSLNQIQEYEKRHFLSLIL